MKKVLVAAMMMANVAGFSVFASNISDNGQNIAIENSLHANGDFKKIELKDLPKAVSDAFKNAYPGSTLKAAYVKENAGKKIYKVEFSNAAGEIHTTQFDSEGKEII